MSFFAPSIVAQRDARYQAAPVNPRTTATRARILGVVDPCTESSGMRTGASARVSGTAPPIAANATRNVREIVRRASVLAVFALCALLAAGRAAGAGPETELAVKYAPVVRLVTNVAGCEDGDPYVPIDVNLLFGNDEVVLRGPWDRVNVVKIGELHPDESVERELMICTVRAEPGTRGQVIELVQVFQGRIVSSSTDRRGWGLRARPGEVDPSKVVMAAKRPDFRRECGREDSNLQGAWLQRDLNPSRLPVPPHPRGFAKDRAEQAAVEMREQEERERESRESAETKYEEAAREESERRSEAVERLPEPPPPIEENDGA